MKKIFIVIIFIISSTIVNSQSYVKLLPTDDCGVTKTKWGELAQTSVTETTNMNYEQNIQLFQNGDDQRIGILKFFIGDIKSKCTNVIFQVRSAVYANLNETTQYPIFLYTISDTLWNERTINWTNQPTYNSTSPIASVFLQRNVTSNSATASGTYSFESKELLNYVNEAIQTGKKYISFVIKTNVSDYPMWIGKRQNAAYSSFLILEGVTNVGIVPILDGQVSSIDISTNYNTLDVMTVKKNIFQEDEKISFLRFNISDLIGTQSAATTNKISLRIKGRVANPGNSFRVNAYLCNESTNGNRQDKYLTETENATINWNTPLNFNTKPNITNTKIASLLLDNSGIDKFYQFSDLGLNDTILLRAKSKYNTITIALIAEDNTNNAIFQRRFSLGNAPTLSIEYPKGNCYQCGDYNKIKPIVAKLEYIETPEIPIQNNRLVNGNGVLKMNTSTYDCNLYYTLNGTNPIPSVSTQYNPLTGIQIFTSSTVASSSIIRVIATKPNTISSDIFTINITTVPVGSVSFKIFYKNDLTNELPLGAEYNRDIVLKLSSIGATNIVYSEQEFGGNYLVYNDLTGIEYDISTTGTKVEYINAYATTIGGYSSPVSSLGIRLIESKPGYGEGPGGVGQKDNKTDNQPELVLWLKSDYGLFADVNDNVHTWEDISGNKNHATDKYKGLKPPFWNWATLSVNSPKIDPVLLNGKKMVKFGDNSGFSSLVIDDNDNLDGSTGLSIFVVARRNWQSNNHTNPLDKRETSPASAQAWAFQMNGGAVPNVPGMQINSTNFELYANNIGYQIWGKADQSLDKPHLLNLDFNSITKTSGVFTDGFLQNSKYGYKNPINSSRAPLVICFNEKMSISEIIIYRTGLNTAHRRIVQNYLDLKYGFDNVSSTGDTLQIYKDTIYSQDLIGIGKIKNEYGLIDQYNTPISDVFNSASAGGIALTAVSGLIDGDFIFAGHAPDNMGVNPNGSWKRIWHIEGKNILYRTKPNAKIRVQFRFDKYEQPAPSNVSSYSLWYSTNGKLGAQGNWINLNIPAQLDVQNGSIVAFETENWANGYYALGESFPTMSSDENVELNLLLYPNPATDYLKFEITNYFKGDIQLRLLDVAGRTIQTHQITKNEVFFSSSISVSNLNQGVYFIEFAINNRKTVKKIVIN